MTADCWPPDPGTREPDQRHATDRFLAWLRRKPGAPVDLAHELAPGIRSHLDAFIAAELGLKLAHLDEHVVTDGDRAFLAALERQDFDPVAQHAQWHIRQRRDLIGPEGS